MEKLSKAFILLLLIGLVYLAFKGNNNKNEIENNGKDSICKFTFCKNSPKTTTAFVKYYIDDKLYRTSCGKCPENCEEKLNKFFKLKYLPEDPKQIIVDFSKEIKNEDSIKELKSKLEFKYWIDH